MPEPTRVATMSAQIDGPKSRMRSCRKMGPMRSRLPMMRWACRHDWKTMIMPRKPIVNDTNTTDLLPTWNIWRTTSPGLRCFAPRSENR